MVEPSQKPMRGLLSSGKGNRRRGRERRALPLCCSGMKGQAYPHKKTKWESMRLLANGLAAARAGRTGFSVPSFGYGKCPMFT